MRLLRLNLQFPSPCPRLRPHHHQYRNLQRHIRPGMDTLVGMIAEFGSLVKSWERVSTR